MDQFALSWHNISVEVTEKRRHFLKTTSKSKMILHNISGSAQSGSLVAILGPSGSGKTTFLAAIAGRLTGKSGTVKINGTAMSNENIKSISGYLHQQDVFTDSLTVLEHLRFMAALQVPDLGESKRHLMIMKFIFELSLERQKHTSIKHLSGGEKRRLSLAAELLHNPYILFCDEPTTGLDSHSAITVVQKLQTISLSGKIILTTIHQPSSQLFDYFNNICLLSSGHLVFQGSKEDTRSFFESIHLICPSTYNPAEFYIKCITENDILKRENVRKVRRKNLNEQDHVIKTKFHDVFLEKKSTASFFQELRWLLWRCFIDMRRNFSAYLIGYFLLLLIGLFLASSYAFVKISDKGSEQSIQGVLFFMVSELTFTNMYAVIGVFPAEVAIFLREKTLYSSGPYFVSKLLSLIPMCIFGAMSYSALFFIFITFLNGFYLWIKFTYMMFLTSMVACGLGLSFSATFSSVEHIDLLMGPLEMFFLIVAGFWVKLTTVSVFIAWLKYLSPFYYGFSSLSNLFWRDIVTGNCDRNQTVPCFNNGSEVLENYGIYKDYDVVAYNIVLLHILIVVFCLIGFAGIFRKRILYSVY